MADLQPGTLNQACQIQSVPKMAEQIGDHENSPLSIRRILKLSLKRHLSPGFKRKAKKRINDFLIWLKKMTGKNMTRDILPPDYFSSHFKAGDLVRIRSKDEIEKTLNRWHELKGCGFLPEMWQYCDTKQRVLKMVERFVDERDYQVKKVRGVVLLEGIICQGTEQYGRCDRACFYFWREEWLTKEG